MHHQLDHKMSRIKHLARRPAAGSHFKKKAQCKRKQQKLDYPTMQKAKNKYKIAANDIVQKFAKGCSKAVVLDTSKFVTCKKLFKVGVKKIVVPQLAHDEYISMRRNVSKLSGSVTLRECPMADAIRQELATMLRAKNVRVCVWHDAMCTWNCGRSTGTTVLDDYTAIVQTYAESRCCKPLTCGLSVCTRGNVAKRVDSKAPLENHKDNIYSDLLDIAKLHSVFPSVESIYRYPQMILFVLTLEKFANLKTGPRPPVAPRVAPVVKMGRTTPKLGDRAKVWWPQGKSWQQGYYFGEVVHVTKNKVKIVYDHEETYDEHDIDQVEKPK